MVQEDRRKKIKNEDSKDRRSYLLTTILDIRSNNDRGSFDPEVIITTYRAPVGDLVVGMATGTLGQMGTTYGSSTYVGGREYTVAYRVSNSPHSWDHDIAWEREYLKDIKHWPKLPVLVEDLETGKAYCGREVFIPRSIDGELSVEDITELLEDKK